MKAIKKLIDYRNCMGQLHRIDGPARIWINGYKEYWINGIYYDKEEFDIISLKYQFKANYPQISYRELYKSFK